MKKVLHKYLKRIFLLLLLLKMVISPQPKKCVLFLRYSGMLKLQSSLLLNTFGEIYGIFFSCFLGSFSLITENYAHF